VDAIDNHTLGAPDIGTLPWKLNDSAQGFVVQAVLQHIRSQRLLVHPPLRMEKDVEVDALIVVDRYDAHPKIFIRVRDKEWRGDRGHPDMDVLAWNLTSPEGRIVESEIGIIDLDARAGVESHIGRGGEFRFSSFFEAPRPWMCRTFRWEESTRASKTWT
jgi:hypothetical protein